MRRLVRGVLVVLVVICPAEPVPAASSISFAGGVAVVHKGAGSGGDRTVTRYHATLAEALESTADATESSPYVVVLPPGIHDLAGSALVLREWVDLQGSGQGVTVVTCACGSAVDPQSAVESATLVTASDSEVRDVTVINTGGAAAYSVAIHTGSTAPRLTGVTAAASGGDQTVGLFVGGGSAAVVRDVTALATGGNTSRAVHSASSLADYEGLTARATDGVFGNTGVLILGSPRLAGSLIEAVGSASNRSIQNLGGSPRLTDVVATAIGGAPNTDQIGFANSGAGHPVLRNVVARATGGSYATGIFNTADASLTAVDVEAGGSGASVKNLGLHGDPGTGTVSIHRSTLSGSTASLEDEGENVVNVGASFLDGPVLEDGTGSLRCVASYTVIQSAGVPVFTPLDASCSAGS